MNAPVCVTSAKTASDKSPTTVAAVRIAQSTEAKPETLASPQLSPAVKQKIARIQTARQPESACTEQSTHQETEFQENGRVKLLSQLPEFRRGGGEIKIGNVMIKLLKSYGITDSEIAEGIANYANRSRKSRAS